MRTHKSTSQLLITWYLKHARDLPWRHTSKPYKIWLSEIILQQTTVAQGLEYYKKFILKYPSVSLLAKASLEDVLKMWEGLGYYSRARNLHFTAQHICNELNGVFPQNYNDLLVLKGVGPYTAAAIASFAFGESVAVVDGNVIRWVSRLFGIEEPVDNPAVQKQIKAEVQKMIANQDPNTFNQASMEFGALCCTFRSPSCSVCPFKKDCIAYKKEIVYSIPTKAKKLIKKPRYFNFFHLIDNYDRTIIQKRQGQDIWKGLYQFPLSEVFSKEEFVIKPSVFLNSKKWNFTFANHFKQTLTHQKINAAFYRIQTIDCLALSLPEDYIVINQASIRDYAFPKIMDLYLSDISIPLF